MRLCLVCGGGSAPPRDGDPERVKAGIRRALAAFLRKRRAATAKQGDADRFDDIEVLERDRTGRLRDRGSR
jgi:hypothetical protein